MYTDILYIKYYNYLKQFRLVKNGIKKQKLYKKKLKYKKH